MGIIDGGIKLGRRFLEQAVDYAGNKIGALSEIGEIPSPAPLSMYDAPAGSKPEYLGAAPDRSDLTYLRYKPEKGYSERKHVSCCFTRSRKPNQGRTY